MGFKTDTIAAISTAMTNSGIGIVRLSGEDAFSIIDKIYKGKSPKLLSEQKSHTIHYGYCLLYTSGNTVSVKGYHFQNIPVHIEEFSCHQFVAVVVCN